MILIKNATIINEGRRFRADVEIDGEIISKIHEHPSSPFTLLPSPNPNRVHNPVRVENQQSTIIDADGFLLLPGIIDDQVHFREPGLTHKGDIRSESRAGLAGGVTSFIDMPNTVPQTTTVEALNAKFDIAARQAMANYAFMLGGTNDNLNELKRNDARRAIAVKVFMGSSTGNMLVDNRNALERIFSEVDSIIVTHCESEEVIARNKAFYTKQFGNHLDVSFHPKIRDAEACYRSSAEAVALAEKYGARLHLFHLSTAREMSLLSVKPLNEKRITAEACVHHLWFTDADYATLGNRIKWNPAIKSAADREALRQALIEGRIDVVATDHAPHTPTEKGLSTSPLPCSDKTGDLFAIASGGPMVQHSLVAMLELCRRGIFTEELVVEKMAHAPASLFGIRRRGYIREGYYADLTLVDPHAEWTVATDNILYRCGWSPMEGETFSHKIIKTFVNGRLAYDNGLFDENIRGKEIEYARY
jgi:dihydroorotase